MNWTILSSLERRRLSLVMLKWMWNKMILWRSRRRWRRWKLRIRTPGSESEVGRPGVRRNRRRRRRRRTRRTSVSYASMAVISCSVTAGEWCHPNCGEFVPIRVYFACSALLCFFLLVFIHFHSFLRFLYVRGCPKAYHAACIKRDESFFRSRAKWNCGTLWFIKL